MTNEAYVYRVTKYKESGFWARLSSRNLSEQYNALREAKTAVVGTRAAKCYFIDRGIAKILAKCLELNGDSEAEEAGKVRLEATAICGCLAQSLEHVHVLLESVQLDKLMQQLTSPWLKLIDATLSTLLHFCVCKTAREILAKHDLDVFLSLIRMELPDLCECRIHELAAKVLARLVDTKRNAVKLLSLGALTTLQKLLSPASQPFSVFAGFECILSLASSIIQLKPMQADIKEFAKYDLHKVFTLEVLSPYMRDNCHPPIQTCAAELCVYVSLALLSDGADPSIPFLQRQLYPTLVKIATKAGDTSNVSNRECQALLLISTLLRFFPDDLCDLGYQSEGFVDNLVVKISALVGEGQPCFSELFGCELCYVLYGIECLAELSSSSEINRLSLCKVPLVYDLLKQALRTISSLPDSLKCVSLRLIHSLSRSPEVLRSFLLEIEAWKLVQCLLKNIFSCAHQPEILVTAACVLSNFVLDVSPMNKFMLQDEMQSQLVALFRAMLSAEPILFEPHRSRVIVEVLYALRNSSYTLPVADASKEIAKLRKQVWLESLEVLNLRREFSTQARQAALSLISQADCITDLPEKKATQAVDEYCAHFTAVLEQGPWQIVLWYVYGLGRMLTHRVVVNAVLDSDKNLLCLRRCLEYEELDVKVRLWPLCPVCVCWVEICYCLLCSLGSDLFFNLMAEDLVCSRC